jgi:NitT/TauT family transport system substrate-binding protein
MFFASPKVARRRVVTVGAVGLAVAGLAACGSSSSGSTAASTASSSSSGSSAGGTTKITVSLVPTAEAAGYYLAQKEGFFAKNGLDVTLVKSNSGGPTIIPALLSGKVQFGDVGILDDVEALAKGFKLDAVGPYAVAPSASETAEEDGTQLVTSASSSISSAKDLEGKKVAVNSLNGLGQLLVDADVKAAGGDFSKVDYVAINFPQIESALKKGEVAASWDVEPFITQSRQDGAIKTITGADAALGPDAPLSIWTASASYAKSNPQVVSKFQTAMNEAYNYAESHKSEKRQITGSIVQVPAATLKGIALQDYSTTTTAADIQKVEDDIIGFGFVKSAPAATTWVIPSSSS